MTLKEASEKKFDVPKNFWDEIEVAASKGVDLFENGDKCYRAFFNGLSNRVKEAHRKGFLKISIDDKTMLTEFDLVDKQSELYEFICKMKSE
jgi:hypothetical protein